MIYEEWSSTYRRDSKALISSNLESAMLSKSNLAICHAPVFNSHFQLVRPDSLHDSPNNHVIYTAPNKSARYVTFIILD